MKKSAAAKKTAGSAKGARFNFARIFTPLDDRVVVEKTGSSERTPGGLYIPDTVSDRPQQGKVVAVGRGHRDAKGRVRPLDVQMGDTVLFGLYTGSELKLEGQDLLVLRENEILGVKRP